MRRCVVLFCVTFSSDCYLLVDLLFFEVLYLLGYFSTPFTVKKHVNLCSRHLLMKSCSIVGMYNSILKPLNKWITFIEYLQSNSNNMAFSIFQLQCFNCKINPKFYATWASLKINIQNDDLLNHPYSKNSLNNIDKLVIILHGAKFSDLEAVYCPGIRIKLSPYIKVTKLKACENPILILKKDSDILDALHI